MKFKLIEQTLNERFINIFQADEKENCWPEVKRLIDTAYEPLGGALGFDKEKYMKDDIFVKMVRKNGTIIACAVYSLQSNHSDPDNPRNRKLRYVGQDGSREGKDAVKGIIDDDIRLTDRNFWAEVSEGIEKLCLYKGAVPIPNDIALQILTKVMHKSVKDDQIKLSSDNVHYTRLIGGKPVEKMMVGNAEVLRQDIANLPYDEFED